MILSPSRHILIDRDSISKALYVRETTYDRSCSFALTWTHAQRCRSSSESLAYHRWVCEPADGSLCTAPTHTWWSSFLSLLSRTDQYILIVALPSTTHLCLYRSLCIFIGSRLCCYRLHLQSDVSYFRYLTLWSFSFSESSFVFIITSKLLNYSLFYCFYCLSLLFYYAMLFSVPQFCLFFCDSFFFRFLKIQFHFCSKGSSSDFDLS